MRIYSTLLALSVRTVFVRSFSSSSGTRAAYCAVPGDLDLKQVVVIHRHGDRAQIARHLGPSYPVSPILTSKWSSVLPSQDTRRLMQASAVTAADLAAADPADLSLKGSLYSGYDQDAIPYAQLTERGSRQLLELGRRLRSRYAATSLLAATHPHPPALHLRSSNLCRTLQSLKCLLAGLLAVDPLRPGPRPFIHANPLRHMESLFPQSEKTCLAIYKRKMELIPHGSLVQHVAGYEELAQRMRRLLGCGDGDHFPGWLTMKDVLHTHFAHNIQHIEGITAQDMRRIDEVATCIWGLLYRDKHMNRLSIGRFINDLLGDLETHADKSLIIYSGHDSTLVPLLCALNAFDDVFPDYASYISLEIASRHADGRRMVRILYNDAVLSLPAGKGAGAGEELEGWLPMEALRAQLQPFAVTQDEYANVCAEVARLDAELKNVENVAEEPGLFKQ